MPLIQHVRVEKHNYIHLAVSYQKCQSFEQSFAMVQLVPLWSFILSLFSLCMPTFVKGLIIPFPENSIPSPNWWGFVARIM